ncbi:uncharacterized protein LOC131252812 isoform X2 [Magnolia sinica]|nr:uncharacterized protein LOC131252812 isoform X2 [Magnolia sinica]
MDAASDAIGRHSVPRASSFGLEEEREVDGRHGSRGRSRHSKSPPIVRHSPSPRRSTPSAARSSSKSFSRSRSYSEERQKSRSVSVSPQPRRRSISPERRFRSPRRRSLSPRRKHSPWNPRSPPRRRSPHSRRRSTSRSRRRSPSPIHRRSPPPMRRRSPSPLRRRSPSPVRRRSPITVRRRSPPPPRRRSPSPRWRSPSPRRRRSPSPLRRRSPLLRSPRHRRRSPVRSPRRRVVDSQISPGERNRSRSPYTSHSPHRSRRSLSRERDSRANGVESKRNIDDYASQRAPGKRSPVRHTLEKEVERHGSGRKGTDSISRQPPISLRSPQRDPKDRNDARHKMPALSPPPENSPSQSGSPPRRRRTSPIEDRMPSPASPARRTRERATRHDSPERSIDGEEISHGREDAGKKADSLRKRIRHSPTVGSRKKPTSKGSEDSPDKFVVSGSSEARGRMDYTELQKKELAQRSDKASMKTDRTSHISEEIEYGPGRLDNFPQDHGRDKQSSAKQLVRDSFSPDERLSNQQVLSRKPNSREDYRGKEKKHPFSSDDEYSDLDRKTEALSKSTKKAGRNDRMGAADSDSEKKESYRKDMERRKFKRSDSRERALDNEAAYDSQLDERKEAKRRRKEDKKLRKEERRRKREERHRRREERRAEKLKAKSIDTVTPPSDFENNQNDAGDSDGDVAEKKDLNASDSEEMESEQKKLEIELRKKALESLRAKKAISH